MQIDESSKTQIIFDSQPIPKQPFVSALLFFKGMLQEILEAIEDENLNSSQNSTHSLDTFHFGIFSHQLQKLKEGELLHPLITERRKELYAQKEYWRSFIETLSNGKEEEFHTKIKSFLLDGKLIPISTGTGSAYFLTDAHGVPHFVVKPVDEDALCLNNRKGFGCPFNDGEHRVREDIPLYRSPQTDAFCWEVAVLAGLEEATPKAVMGIIQDDRFYDFIFQLEENRRATIIHETGAADKEKLCSIQEFIQDSQDLTELLHQFYAQGYSDLEIASRFDQMDFEAVCLFLWLTYDSDAHSGNFRTYVKRVDETGKEIYGIKKIDNSLSFPEQNAQYNNVLAWMPNAVEALSHTFKKKIAALPMDALMEWMDVYGLSASKPAFQERMVILKELADREGITLAEIDLRLSLLSKKEGKKFALSTLTTQQILQLLTGETSP